MSNKESFIEIRIEKRVEFLQKKTDKLQNFTEFPVDWSSVFLMKRKDALNDDDHIS